MAAEGGVVRHALSQVFAVQDWLGTYVLNDQGARRKHISILVDGQRIHDLEYMSDPVRPPSEI